MLTLAQSRFRQTSPTVSVDDMNGSRGSMQSRTGLAEGKDVAEKFSFNPKEGIDNPAMVITDDADSAPSPRLCLLNREDDGESYGFRLRVERGRLGHIIRSVAPGGAAAHGGLRDGDRLLEVNDCYVNDLPHPEVAQKIKLSGNQLRLLVLDGEGYEQALYRGQDLQSVARASQGESCKPPRLCHITKDPASGLGISFTPADGQKSRFTVSLLRGGAAERAGVCKGDLLVWMNGATVSDLTHAALRRMMKKCGDHITILVIDGESEKHYLQQRMPILPTPGVPHNLPHTARKLQLLSDSRGFGFVLRLEKATSGRTFHVLQELESGGPAERAGVKDGDVLLEVNGESVESLKHGQIAERVRQSGQKVSVTTITPQGLEFYTKLGLSPLLFCEEDSDEAIDRKETSTAEQTSQRETGKAPKSRLCSLQKGPLGFGFNLGCVPRRPGTFISQVAVGGPGQRAGLHVGDVVLEVNGQNVAQEYLEDVIMLMKEGGRSLSLRVKEQAGHPKRQEKTPPAAKHGEEKYKITCL
ncbi:NHERF family PDZ scaffold protein 4b isoform X2 [Takifugu rubripes]|uniref:NHERF family PDZ scaffold protein 4b n=2 Tax=Takifugu rubripes TaxID=31033 RepID=H2S7V1_TAKRU|nr:Na(+)/H(+) exchange regulatory cofactor NHE-RF4-like isoform X2 [Takifugu rubripes]